MRPFALGRIARRAELRVGSWLHRLRDRPGRYRVLGEATREALRAQEDPSLLGHRAEERLARVLGAAGRRRFYADRLPKQGEGDPYVALSAIPALEKADLHRGAASLLRESPEDVDVTWTSGTSGRVTQVVRPREAEVERAALDRRLYDALGLPDFFDFVVVVPWREPGATLWGLHDWRVRCRQVGLDEVARAAEANAPLGDVLVSAPVVCERLAEIRNQPAPVVSAFELSRPSRAFVLGEPEGSFEAPSEFYATSELSAAIAFRFPGCRYLHVNADAMHLEVVGPGSAEPLPDGEAGELLITDLLNDAMPLVRYRIGDIGILRPGPCSCGRAPPTLQLMGRNSAVGDEAVRFLEDTGAGRSREQLVVQVKRRELAVLGSVKDAEELRRRARSNGLRLAVNEALPDGLAALAARLQVLSIAERVPSDQARGRSLRELRDELGVHDARVELEATP